MNKRSGTATPKKPRATEAPAEHHYRTFEGEIRRRDQAEGERAEAATYDISVSSEFPVKRWDWEIGEYLEVLSHEPKAVDLSRAKNGLSVRDSHYGDQIGIGRKTRVDEKKLRTAVQFSKGVRAQEIRQDVDDEIRTFVSIGYDYDVKDMVLVKKGENGQPSTYLIERWTPIHVAFVPDPADYTVGVGRGQDAPAGTSRNAGAAGAREDSNMPCDRCKQASCVCPPASGGGVATREQPSPGAGPAPSVQVVNDARVEERKRSKEIYELAEAWGMREHAAKWVDEGLTVDQASREILKLKATKGPGQPAQEALVPLNKKDRARFSYSRALAALADGRPLDGLEREVNDEIRSKLPQNYVEKGGGIFLPTRLSDEPRGKRTISSMTPGSGGDLVMDQPGDLIELLRNESVALQLGARQLTGLTAPIPFPKQTAAATVYWVGENPGTDVTSSDVATGIVVLSGKTLQGNSPIPRQLLNLSSVDAEQLVREDLMAGHGLAIDRGVFHGKGSASEPTGLYVFDSVQSKPMGGVPTWAKLTNIPGLVKKKNALRGSLGWVTTPLMAAGLMATPRISGAAGGWLWEGNINEGQIAGFRALSSNQISDTMSGAADTGGAEQGMAFGDWRQCLIGLWGALEVILDPYTKKRQGQVEICTFQMADVIFRHPEAFVVTTGATLP